MKHRICIVDSPKLAYAKLGIEEYLPRLRHFGGADVRIVRSAKGADTGKQLLDSSKGCFKIVLDERGALYSTAELSLRFDRWESANVREVAWLIGGADGHTELTRESADEIISLSPLTLQHELALLMLLEQIYRVESLRNGLPYHRP